MAEQAENNVLTKDVPRPADDSVVVSDSPTGTTESRAAGSDKDQRDSKKASAAADTGTNDQDSATGDDNPKPKRKSSVERRFRRMTRKMSELEERALQAERALEEVRNQPPARKEPPAKPQRSDFKTDEEYAEAYAEFKQATKDAQRSPSKPSKPKADTKPPEPPKEVKDWQEKGREKFGEEWDEALGVPIPCNQFTAEFVMDHPEGHEIYLHLADNPDLAKKIFDASPYRATKLLEDLAKKAEKGELDEDDEDEDEEEEEERQDKKKAKRSGRKTKANDPPDHREKGDLTQDENLEEMDMDEYAKRRRKQELRKMGYVEK